MEGKPGSSCSKLSPFSHCIHTAVLPQGEKNVRGGAAVNEWPPQAESSLGTAHRKLLLLICVDYLSLNRYGEDTLKLSWHNEQEDGRVNEWGAAWERERERETGTRSESVDKLALAERCLRRATAPSSCHSCKIRNIAIKNWLIRGKCTQISWCSIGSDFCERFNPVLWSKLYWKSFLSKQLNTFE